MARRVSSSTKPYKDPDTGEAVAVVSDLAGKATERRTDQETGEVTEVIKREIAAGLSPDELAAMRAGISRRQRANSLEGVLEEAGANLDGLPSTVAAELRRETERVRRLRSQRQFDQMAAAAYRLGYQRARADALTEWSVVKAGRDRRKAQGRGGHQERKAAAKRSDKRAAAIIRRYEAARNAGGRRSWEQCARDILRHEATARWDSLDSNDQQREIGNAVSVVHRRRRARANKKN